VHRNPLSANSQKSIRQKKLSVTSQANPAKSKNHKKRHHLNKLIKIMHSSLLFTINLPLGLMLIFMLTSITKEHYFSNQLKKSILDSASEILLRLDTTKVP